MMCDSMYYGYGGLRDTPEGRGGTFVKSSAGQNPQPKTVVPPDTKGPGTTEPEEEEGEKK